MSDQTRPISLLDAFFKVQNRLFHNRFLRVLQNQELIPAKQFGFRARLRLQIRVLLLLKTNIISYDEPLFDNGTICVFQTRVRSTMVQGMHREINKNDDSEDL